MRRSGLRCFAGTGKMPVVRIDDRSAPEHERAAHVTFRARCAAVERRSLKRALR